MIIGNQTTDMAVRSLDGPNQCDKKIGDQSNQHLDHHRIFRCTIQRLDFQALFDPCE